MSILIRHILKPKKIFVIASFIFIQQCHKYIELSFDIISERKLEEENSRADDPGGFQWMANDTEYIDPCINPPAIDPQGCGIFEKELSGICIASNAGVASFRFNTQPACIAEVNCTRNNYPYPVFRTAQQTISTHHNLILENLPQNEMLNCKVACHCNETGNEFVLADGVEVFVSFDGGVKITEILLDPSGKEPEQEFIEIINHSGLPVDISGWKISDFPPECWWMNNCSVEIENYGDTIPEGTVLQHMVPVLITSANYDENSASDPVPPPGCTIIRLDGSLANRGLKNSGGEPVFLFDPERGIVSFYPNSIGTTGEGISVERTKLKLPDGNPVTWIKNPAGSSSPCFYEEL